MIIIPLAILPRLSLSASPIATPQVPITAMIDAVFIPMVASAVISTTISRTMLTSDTMKLDIASSRFARRRMRLSTALISLTMISPTTRMIMPKRRSIPAFLK